MNLKSVFYFPAHGYTRSFALMLFLFDFQLWVIFLLDQKNNRLQKKSNRTLNKSRLLFPFYSHVSRAAMFSTHFLHYSNAHFYVSFLLLISLCDPQQLLMLYPLSVCSTKSTKGNTLTCFALIELVVGIGEKECLQLKRKRAKSQNGKSKKQRKERKMKNKSITKQSFNEIKVSHRKLFNQKLRIWLLSCWSRWKKINQFSHQLSFVWNATAIAHMRRFRTWAHEHINNYSLVI